MELQGTKSAMEMLITLYEPTEQMKHEAIDTKYYESKTWGHKYPKIQIVTVAELLKGIKPILPIGIDFPHNFHQVNSTD